jgi:class 3 adenylate cyclase/streptogramin lyase
MLGDDPVAMPDAISATATFLFTDIEGSTQLLKAHRVQYATILAEHHRLLREAFAAYGGKEVDNQGDAFFVAFVRARDAVLAAAAAQRAFAEHSWPDGASVRVRMGIHTGEADLAIDRYVGLSVHRAARISGVSHGGQVLVSQTTASLLEDDEDDLPGIALKDLGEHRLKDIARPVRLYELEIEGLRRAFPPLKLSRPSEPDPRRRAVLVGAGLLLAGFAAAITLVLTTRSEAPPPVLPNSLVRIDPETLKPTQVVPIGSAPDLVVAAGGFVWVTHHILRDFGSGALRDAGDRTLTRVDPETAEVVTIGGGLAPCGLAGDPSGDVWVANCFASGGRPTNVVRIDATSLRFKATWPVPGGEGFYRGLAYGGGSLWVSEVFGGDDEGDLVTEVDPETGAERQIHFPKRTPGTPLAWSEGYGDLWFSNFDLGTLTKIHPSTRAVETIDSDLGVPGATIVAGDVVWVGDWHAPRIERLRAVGTPTPRTISLPVQNALVGVWTIAAGEGYVWATTPRDGAVWRIDPETNVVTRIAIPHFPTGITTSAGNVWVTVRKATPR